MDYIAKFIITIVLSVVITLVSCEQAINMKALILTASYESEPITLVLDSYGIPYDIISFPSTENFELYNYNNEPKYNLVIINGGNLNINSNGLWLSAMSKEQWDYLDEYESKYGIRRVIIAEDVSTNPNIVLYEPNNWGETSKDQPLFVDNSDEVKKIFNDARIKMTAPLDVNQIYYTRVKIINTSTTHPFLYYSEDGNKGAVAATISKFENGREEMSFFFSFGTWSQTCIILNHLWLTWGTRSLFNGFRRVYFTPHVDDIFLSTTLVDPENNSAQGSNFRIKPYDYQKIAQFQKDVLDIMPEGSFYRIELAFNGNGILNEADYLKSVGIDVNSYVDAEYVMEPGTGEKRWPKENYKLTLSQIETFGKDDVFSYFIHNDTAQKEFFWSSHTFTHENLNNISESDVDNEIRLNIEVAKILGLADKDYWSSSSIITPQISGLHNKEALEVFMKYGINSATGDVSRPVITNMEHPYLPFITTKESSNLEGFPIIPRTPTEIYFPCSTREENTWSYNQIYGEHYGQESTFDQILERESTRTLVLLTKLRHEAHQFHQANIRHYPKEGHFGESLLEDWTRSVVNLYTKYVDWPLISLKLDKQAETYIERAKLESCGPETKLILENNKIVSITISASVGDCSVPITVPGGVDESSLPDDAILEQIGKDPLTVWIPLKKGETKSFKLEPAYEWSLKSPLGSNIIPTIKENHNTSTTKELPITSTTKQNPITSTTKELPITSTTSKQLPIPTTTKELPIPTTTKQLPIPTTSKQLPIPTTTKQLPVPTTTKQIPNEKTAIKLVPVETINTNAGFNRTKQLPTPTTTKQITNEKTAIKLIPVETIITNAGFNRTKQLPTPTTTKQIPNEKTAIKLVPVETIITNAGFNRTKQLPNVIITITTTKKLPKDVTSTKVPISVQTITTKN